MSEKRLALLIASDQYEKDSRFRPLVTPPQDVKALAQVLQDPAIGHFDEVKTLINEPESLVRREIARFYHNKSKDDLLLLYFSGHGVLDAWGRLYLAITDTEHDYLSATAIPAAYISNEMDNSRSRRQALILDCCHSGAFEYTKGILGSSVGTARAFEGNGYGRVVLTASDATEYAWEGDQVTGEAETSVFTYHFVQGLRTGAADRDADGWITLDEVSDYVYEQVIAQATKQKPGKFSYKQQGQIIIARNPKAIVKRAELPVGLQQALESPFAGIRKGVVEELGRLLRGSDKGLAAAAQEGLARLAEDDSRQVSAAATEALGRMADPLPASSNRPIGVEALAGEAPGRTTGPSPVSLPLARPAGRDDLPDKEALPQKDRRERPSLRVEPGSQVRATAKPKPPPPKSVLTLAKPIALDLVHIPAGEFLMGSNPSLDKQAKAEEQPQHTLCLPDYYIARTPVTNSQYAIFAQMGGYEKPGHWENGKIPKGEENHPVISVSWQAAVAFCKWLSRETGRLFRLPSEAEWEKAARGPDGRIYPWGNKFNKNKCNTNESGISGTTPVGQYSAAGGDSPYGVADMAGNVWEWCSTQAGKDWKNPEFKRYPYDVTEDEWADDYLSGTSGRVLRGGAWSNIVDNARCSARLRYNPDIRRYNLGFRLVSANF